jgi:hypothetical protein
MAVKYPVLRPFDVNTPLINKEGHTPGVGIDKYHIQYQQDLNAAVNNSLQQGKIIPVSSVSPGIKGQTVSDGLFFYVHNGTQWVKFTGVAF